MKNIALAFSGGGYRAACFSLGSLSYLRHVRYGGDPLLENVKFISSTSGGSITNLVYAKYLFNGNSFEECYAFLLSELDGEKLLESATAILQSSPEWSARPEKSRNLINAFSIAYDKLFERTNFGLFSDHSKKPHLDEICVNATEFTNGLPFRFQSQAPASAHNGKVGNRFIFFNEQGLPLALKIKLSDILAASSCFPSGFEPMIFPNDFTCQDISGDALRSAISFTANSFTLRELDDKKLRQRRVNADQSSPDENAPGYISTEPTPNRQLKYGNVDLIPDKEFTRKFHFGLMDGGVDDNQAIDAFEKAYERRTSNPDDQFDLFISCDVTSNFLDGYTLPLQKKDVLSSIPLYVLILLWLAVMAVLPSLAIWGRQSWTGWMYITGTISGTTWLPALYLFFSWIRSFFTSKTGNSSFNAMLKKYGPRFLGLPIGVLKQMIAARIKSVFLLANDIYLKQIRRMYYSDVFSNPLYQSMSIQNAIYTLSRVNFPSPKPADPLCPSAEMVALAEQARMMGTTLWFDNKNQQENIKRAIVATGQFTTCYSLLNWLIKKENAAEGGLLETGLSDLKKSLEIDYAKFKENALFLYKRQSVQ